MTERLTTKTYDAIVIGAGISGIYQLHKLREQGLEVRLLEAGSGVGGTWYWNRYPGCRFDSESYIYGYFFSEEVINEWSWSEEFAGQPETEQYLNFVVDRVGLRDLMQFNARVKSAHFNEASNTWAVTLESGEEFTTRFLVTALGILSAPVYPNIPGLDAFKGEAYHTGLWPKHDVSFKDKRVAMIGTGSSGVQLAPIIQRDAKHLTVFQRTPNWCAPINNHPLSEERKRELREKAREIHAFSMESPSGSVHKPKELGILDVPEDQRYAELEKLYNAPGLTLTSANFYDVSRVQEANDVLTSFMAERIRERVKDPVLAEKLIPKDHGFGQKRPPLENGYYEMYNEPNVTLVSTKEDPILEFTQEGIRTESGLHEFDMIVFATGFDAIVGSYNRIDIRGVDGATLREHWQFGPRTYLGIFNVGFPNLFMVGGPQAVSGNIPRFTEVQADWITALIEHAIETGATRVSTTDDGEDYWSELTASFIRGTMQEKANSWAWGTNIPGKPRAFQIFAGGLPRLREELAKAANSYPHIVFDKAGERIANSA